MISEEIEFLISQHLDGTLEPIDQEKLRHLLAGDAEVRKAYHEHAQIHGALRGLRVPVEHNADELTRAIGQKLDEHASTSLPMPVWARVIPMAAAAALLIGLGVAIAFLSESNRSRNGFEVAANTRALVSSPLTLETPSPGVAVVSVGTPTLSPQTLASLYVAHQSSPGRVLIAPRGHAMFDDLD